jgi:hypothetical protein
LKLLGLVVKRDEVRAGFTSVIVGTSGSRALSRIKGSYTLTPYEIFQLR